MALAVRKFFEFRPHLPFRFEVEFFTGLPMLTAQLKYAVQSVKISGTECDIGMAASYFGDGYTTIPIFNVASRTLTITFEETDQMKVLSMVDAIVDSQRNGSPWVLGVRVTEYDTRFRTIVSDRYYKCIMKDYDEPAFSRTGGPGIVTSSITLNIMSDQPWNTSNAEQHNVGKSQNVNLGTDELTNQLDIAIDATKPSQPLADQLGAYGEEFKKALEAAKKAQGSSSSEKDLELRPTSMKTEEIQSNEKAAAKMAGVSYAAMAMANGGEGDLKGKAFEARKTITDDEIKKAKKIDEQLKKTPGGVELASFVEELSDKQYWLAHKGKDGDISKTDGLDCSGAAGAWASKMGYDINECTAGAKNGGLVKQLVAQGATDVGQNYDKGLKPGDILNKTSTKEGNTGHVVIFLGYDGAGNMLIAESAGRTGEGNNASAGGRVRTVSIQGMKDAGYTGVKIMDNAPKLKKK